MTTQRELINVNIAGSERLITPQEIKKILPAGNASLTTVLNARHTVEKILDNADPRKFMIIGPCSIHDPKAAREYAERLKALSHRVREKIFILMRVYFEKPRTTVGWKGLINDPFLDDSFHMEEGLKIARQLLIDLTEMGLPTASEALDPVTPQYISELISWSAIGARTTESQTHREIASGLSMPVGFKNGTDGNIQVAINAMKSSLTPHHFLGIDQQGKISKFSTRGNRYSHIVLRGGGGMPNYDVRSVTTCEETLEREGLTKKIVIDCSHDNSNKDHNRQPFVLMECLKHIEKGNNSLCGFMIESNLFAGNQKIGKDIKQLKYGVSITDKCVDWKTTEMMVLNAYKSL